METRTPENSENATPGLHTKRNQNINQISKTKQITLVGRNAIRSIQCNPDMDRGTTNANSQWNKKWKQLPKAWKNGAVVHIYKNKGDVEGCGNYRPVSLLQIAYKIRRNLITRRLEKILHIVTPINQYGYKENVSTIDAIVKIEQYIEHNSTTQNILLTGLSKAFDTVNRTILWETLYEKGIPIQAILQIRRGHIETTLQEKHNKQYGEKNRQRHGGSSKDQPKAHFSS